MAYNNIQPRQPKFKAIIKDSGKIVLVTALVSTMAQALEDMNERLDDIKYADNGEKVIIDAQMNYESYSRSLWAKEEPGALAMRVMHVSKRGRTKNKTHLVLGKIVMV